MAIEDNYVYITDQDCYRNIHSKRTISIDTLQKMFWTAYKDNDKISKIFILMKEAGLTQTEFTPDKPSNSLKGMRMFELIKDILPFKWMTKRNGQKYIYNVTEENECTIIEEEKSRVDSLIASLQSRHDVFNVIEEKFYNSEFCESTDFEDFLKKSLGKFLLIQDFEIDTPKILSWEKDDYAFKKFDPSVIVKGETPAWDEFLNRMDYPEVFMAWIWCMFDPENMGRQVMWLRGPGTDGKSTACRVIQDYYGAHNCASITKDNLMSNRFFYSSLYGKRFLLASDTQNTKLITSTRLHNIVGGDPVSVEFKNKTAFTEVIYCRVLVTSNYSPEIDFSRKNEVSRTIRLDIKDLDVNYGDKGIWEKKMFDEMPNLLYKCREQAKKICPTGVDLKLPAGLMEVMEEECSSSESIAIFDYVANYIIFEKDGNVSEDELDTSLRDFLHVREIKKGISLATTMTRLKDLLTRRGAKRKRITVNGKRVRGWTGIRVRQENIQLKSL